MAHLYKSRLQNYAQKRNITFPIYSCEMQGPPHCRLFKATVTVDGNTYVGPEFCTTLKDAEHAAAKVAFLSLEPDGTEEDDCLYKSLLQELAQKRGLLLPIYATNRTGSPHMPSFGSSVKIAGECYVGQEARTKKQAEMNAAKVAYNALTEGGPRGNNAATLSNMQTVGTSSSGSHSLQTIPNHVREPTLIATTSGPRANTSAAISNRQMAGTFNSGSHTWQPVMTPKNEPSPVPATNNMQTANNNEAKFLIAEEAEKGKGYLDLKNLQDVIDKHKMTLPPVVIHQSQPTPTPNAVNSAKMSIKQEYLGTQAGEGSSSNGKKVHVSFIDSTASNTVMGSGAARPCATKILIRPHVAGMMLDGPIQVSDDEWVAMKVNVDDET